MPARAAQRTDRAHRILDAAGELVVRWGYDKSTVDDVARHAGVAKGTIYLHWSTREALFAALLRCDRLAVVRQARRDTAAAPGGATLRGMLGALALALLRRPLLKAVFLGDAEVLGKLVRRKPSSEAAAAMRSGFERYLDALREHDAIRADLSARDQVNAILGVLYGFLLVTPLLPEDYRLPDERLAEPLADAAHRALRPDDEIAPDVTAAVARATATYLDAMVEVAEARFQLSLTTRDLGEELVS